MQKRAATVLLATALGGAVCAFGQEPPRSASLYPSSTSDASTPSSSKPIPARGVAAPEYMEGWMVPPPKKAAAPKPKGVAAPAVAPRPAAALPAPTAIDSRIRRTQTDPAPAEPENAPAALPESGKPAAPAPAPTAPAADGLAVALNRWEGSGRSISLQAALYGTISNNPDLVALRNSNVASPEAVEVARHFPTALNPTVWIDYRPITLVPNGTFGNGSSSSSSSSSSNTSGNHGFYHNGQQYILFSIRQPIELGHQTTHRYNIACAALSQQQWTVVQAELAAMVQTYRFFQTAAYRREKLRVALDLADFNNKLIHALRRRQAANQMAAADVVLAEVENEATRQQADVARQDYANALADLRNQLGLPDEANAAEPLGEFVLPANIPPLDENALIQMALKSRPDIHAARAQAQGAMAAVNLARGDRIPTPVVGPQYAQDEAGIQYFGLILVSPIPILNNGAPLVRQREADYRRALVNVQQVEKRTVVQVRAAAAKWNAANRLVGQSAGLTGSLRDQVARMERLFNANQADLTKLLQSRQRLIQLENARLDALWQATQAQSDLLLALGIPNLIAALNAHPNPAASAPAPTAVAR